MTLPDIPRAPPLHRFSSSDAAFEGFRLLRDEPSTVLAWAAVYLAFSLGSTLLTIALVGTQVTHLTQLQALGRAAPPAEMFAAMGALAPYYLMVLIASLAFYATLNAAVNRTVLRPEARGFGRLRFGAEELRQAGVMLAIWLVLFVTYIALALVVILAVVVFGLALHSVLPGALGPILAILGGVCGFGALIYVMVRMSLLSACTFDTGRISLGRAWRLTRGRVWPLLGAYLLAWLMMAVVALGFVVVFVAMAAIFGGGLAAAGAVMHPTMSSLGAYFGPVQVVFIVLSSLLYGLYFAVFIGTPANAYLQITKAGSATGSSTSQLESGF